MNRINSTEYSAKTVVSKRISLQPPPRRPAKEQMRLNGVQRQTVRVAIATGATIAAIVGAQTLALLDRSAIVKPIVLGNAASAASSDNNPTVDPNAAANAANASATPAAITATPLATATKGKPSLNLSDNVTSTPVPRTGVTKKPSAARTPQAVTSSNVQPYPLSLSS